jgi:hypothetical protein
VVEDERDHDSGHARAQPAGNFEIIRVIPDARQSAIFTRLERDGKNGGSFETGYAKAPQQSSFWVKP